jgi:hypothetical protein
MMAKYLLSALAVLVFFGVAVWALKETDAIDEQDK